MPKTRSAPPLAQNPAAMVQAKFNQGLALHKHGKLPEAERVYGEILRRQPNHFGALHMFGVIAVQKKQTARGIELITRAIKLNAGVAAAHNNLGYALLDLRRPADALASYNRAIALKPDYAEAYCNRGIALRDLKRPAEALASFDKAIALKPDHAEAYCNRGNALRDLERPVDAVASYDKAIALKPDYAAAYYNRGAALRDLKRLEEAVACYDKAMILKPHPAGVEGFRLQTKMYLCDWKNFASECVNLISVLRKGKANTAPFPLLALPSSSDDQLRGAKLWVAHKFPPSEKPLWHGERYKHQRIRVAYLSADLRQHAISYLTAGMFECHDKSRFEITAISIGPADNSALRQRLKRSFEHFIDAMSLSDNDIASLIREKEIDILIDLMGFTRNARTGVVALRPAPIQVNYLGYPGTMGAEYIDYIIADSIVIPEDSKQYYSERIAYLPNSYLVNDSKRSISDKVFTRAELGLPSMNFVFCCFNDNYKITPHVFDCWMRILNRVEGSVLWLLEGNASAASNLRKEAEARGVDAERLIFAKRLPVADHLARHRQADLALDTLPYNAHTTACDALWAGLPVLTCLGETFAGRVAGSLLKAINLPELITTTQETYEHKAVDLATHSEQLANIKRKLTANRFTAPLFDTKHFTKHIEAAYTAMYERHQAGLPPAQIIIPN
ncbi:MAG: tetratricopeptide repeat protein [Steroidobacteraceae bacterium]